jgi:hypothetical protein
MPIELNRYLGLNRLDPRFVDNQDLLDWIRVQCRSLQVDLVLHATGLDSRVQLTQGQQDSEGLAVCVVAVADDERE